MSQPSATGPSRSRIVLAIILGLAGAALVAIVVTHFFLAHEIGHLPLLAELPRAGLVYNGMELAMDGSPVERFHLVRGFADPAPSPEAQDGWCRDVTDRCQLHFTRWQMKDLALRLRLAPLADTRQMTLALNGKPGQTVYLEPGYHDVVMPLPNAALEAGDNLVEFDFAGGQQSGAVIDSIRWEVGGEAAGSGISVEKRSLGERTVPVLGSGGSAEVNFYVQVPPGARLLLGLGHDRSDMNGSPGRLSIWGRNEEDIKRELWEGEFPRGGIKNLNLDMGELAGKLSLLSFYIKPNPDAEDWLYVSEPRLEYPDTKHETAADNPAPPAVSSKRPRTIVLICEDALRHDFLPLYGNTTITTPNLDRIAQKGLLFDNAYSPSSWTKHVFASIYTAQPGGRHLALKHDGMLSENVTSLVDSFRQNGWRTAIITANPYTSDKFGLNRGFVDLCDLSSGDIEELQHKDKIHAEYFLPLLAQWLATLHPNENAFMVLHFMDTHAPYIAPPGYGELYRQSIGRIFDRLQLQSDIFSPALRQELLDQLAQYCGSITYFDAQLPAVLAEFAKAGRAEGITFVFFSDHGEEFLDHGGIKHGFTLYQEMIHVPLLMWGEGVDRGRSQEFINLEDLMPTLLELAGIAVPDGIEGRSFAAIVGGRDAGWDRRQFSETEQNIPGYISLTWHGFKLIIRDNICLPPGQEPSPMREKFLSRQSSYELYDLQNDPLERTSLDNSDPLRVGYYEGFLREWWAKGHQGKQGEVKKANLDTRTIEVLKGLGYLQ
jgi:arylsulfatase A-like enzyme